VSLTVSPRGKHRAEDRIAELEAQVRQLEADNVVLAAANETLVCDLTRTIVRASQDAIRRAQADDENTRLKKANEDWRHQTIRAKAEQERLRRAVINARPRIKEVPTDLVRPYSPVVVLPYLSPVRYVDTSNEKTQQLPVLDWPKYPTPAA
jgi:hypothetical protein